MKNWSIFKFAMVGFIAGFVLNVLVFSIGFWSSEKFTLTSIVITGILTGILGIIMAILIKHFFANSRLDIAKGLFWGIAFYFGWTIGAVYILYPILGFDGDIYALPSLPGMIFFLEKNIVLEEHLSVLWSIVTLSWLFWGFIGAGIGYLLERRRARVSK